MNTVQMITPLKLCLETVSMPTDIKKKPVARFDFRGLFNRNSPLEYHLSALLPLTIKRYFGNLK